MNLEEYEVGLVLNISRRTGGAGHLTLYRNWPLKFNALSELLAKLEQIENAVQEIIK